MGIIQPRATVLREALEQKKQQPQPHDEKALLTVYETLAMLRFSRNKLYEYVRRNELPSVQFGRRRLFRRSDVLAFIEQHQVGTSA
jgi:excisionase family DNA binding protein